jgi:hypothetical protein
MKQKGTELLLKEVEAHLYGRQKEKIWSRVDPGPASQSCDSCHASGLARLAKLAVLYHSLLTLVHPR